MLGMDGQPNLITKQESIFFVLLIMIRRLIGLENNLLFNGNSCLNLNYIFV